MGVRSSDEKAPSGIVIGWEFGRSYITLDINNQWWHRGVVLKIRRRAVLGEENIGKRMIDIMLGWELEFGMNQNTKTNGSMVGVEWSVENRF